MSSLRDSIVQTCRPALACRAFTFCTCGTRLWRVGIPQFAEFCLRAARKSVTNVTGPGFVGSEGRDSSRELFGPEKSGPTHFLVMSAGLAGPSCLALLARTPIPQKLPRINPQLVVIVEMKLDRVLAHALGRNRFDRRLEHRQRPGGKSWRLSRLLVRLGSRFVAQRARTGITQEGKGIMRPMAILPLDIQTRARAQSSPSPTSGPRLQP